MTDDDKQAHFAAMNPLVNALFDRAEDLIESAGHYVPFAAVLDASGDLRLIEASPPSGEATVAAARSVVPVLHETLREQVATPGCVAVGVAELVALEPDSRNAIKVVAEHASGFAMAFYLPWDMDAPGEVSFDEVIQNHADPVVGGWS